MDIKTLNFSLRCCESSLACWRKGAAFPKCQIQGPAPTFLFFNIYPGLYMQGFLMQWSCSLKRKLRRRTVHLSVAQLRGAGSLGGSEADAYTQQMQGTTSATSGESYSKLLKLPRGCGITNALPHSTCRLSILPFPRALPLCSGSRHPDLFPAVTRSAFQAQFTAAPGQTLTPLSIILQCC